MRYSEVVSYLFIVTKGDLPSFSFKSPINQGSTFFAIHISSIRRCIIF